jgi:hypothetical protein
MPVTVVSILVTPAPALLVFLPYHISRDRLPVGNFIAIKPKDPGYRYPPFLPNPSKIFLNFWLFNKLKILGSFYYPATSQSLGEPRI